MDACKDNLLVALVCVLPDLRNDFFSRQTYTFASYLRNDTKTAPEITAVLNLDQSARPEGLYIGFCSGFQSNQNPVWQILFFLIPKNLPHLRIFLKIIEKPF